MTTSEELAARLTIAALQVKRFQNMIVKTEGSKAVENPDTKIAEATCAIYHAILNRLSKDERN